MRGFGRCHIVCILPSDLFFSGYAIFFENDIVYLLEPLSRNPSFLPIVHSRILIDLDSLRHTLLHFPTLFPTFTGKIMPKFEK
jgi:hypothetical protein